MSDYNNLKIKNNVVGFDTECTGIVPYGDYKRWGYYPARPFAFSFYDDEGNSAYFRWEVDPMTREVIPNPKSLREMKKILENKKIRKVGHNLSYDIRMCHYGGIELTGPVDDTIIMAHVVTGGDEMSYALKGLGEKYLGVSKDDEKALQEATIKARNKGKKLGWSLATKEHFGREPIKADYWMAPDSICMKYAVTDAERTMLFWMLWREDIRNDPRLEEVYQREMKVFHVVAKMENRGVRVFPEELKSLREFYTKYADKQMRLADKHGGKGLNFRSPKQMVNKFITEKGYEPKYYTKKGNPQISGDFLKELAEKHDDRLARAILEFRGATHMISGFLDPYDRFRVKEKCDGRDVWTLHPNFRQAGPITGRFSCGDPNLMQVASETTGRRRTEITLRPRESLGPREGCYWYLPDYSQIEVWVFSFLAQEEAMMQALLSGRDFHGSIAERVWGNRADYKENKSYYRKCAKLLMFCNLYGGGVKKVAYLLQQPLREAEKFVAQYHGELPGVNRYMRRMINKAKREGKIFNPFGRMYYIPEQVAYRAVNYMIQGTSADIMKEAMVNVDNLFSKKWKGCHMLLTLHDELILEIPKKFHSKKLMRDIFKAMQGKFHERIGSPVPLKVSMKVALKRWSEAKEIKV